VVDIEHIRPFVASNLSGMMRANVDRCIQWAAYDFATRTGCQKEVVDGYYIDSIKQISFGTSMPESEVIRVIQVKLDGRTLNADDMEIEDGAATVADSLGDDQPCKVTLISRPKIDAKSFSDMVGIRHQQSIVNGALHRGHAMSGGEWYSPDLSEHKRKEYELGIGKTKRECFESEGGLTDYRRII